MPRTNPQLCLREAASDGDRELVTVLLNKGVPVEAVIDPQHTQHTRAPFAH